MAGRQSRSSLHALFTKETRRYRSKGKHSLILTLSLRQRIRNSISDTRPAMSSPSKLIEIHHVPSPATAEAPDIVPDRPSVDTLVGVMGAIPLRPPRDPVIDIRQRPGRSWFGRSIGDSRIVVTVSLKNRSLLAARAQAHIDVPSSGIHGKRSKGVSGVQACQRIYETAANAFAGGEDSVGVNAVGQSNVC